MKPETLELLTQELGRVSRDSLHQFAKAVLLELEERGIKYIKRPKLNGFWELKDCDPTHEP